ncbi:3-dehydroquinate synthase [Candidatus Methylocalor cossyra]|uniref:3-dehydroquinate synthase n=1 Tax=Candidatus Methylocalor cossyra TaxID=3108543 RepID=A0ABP1C9A4_9GAMM
MRTLEVALGDRSYPIYIGAGLLRRGEWLTRHLDTGQVMIVTNATIAPLYLEALKAQLVGYQVGTVVLPDGEEYKTMDSAMLIWDALLDHRFSRQAHVVALGGGVIGDLAGFAAACYQRGVPFVQIPTTLLAQVDSSVGGKTAVNHRRGKNMIGAFHQPRCVIADTDTLATLADREFRAGLAEVVKYGLIRDAEFFAWLEQRMEALLRRDPESLAFAIERCCRNKAEVVAADERESGERAMLNLGHTFGHAIEAGLGYGTILHGEAVAIGICQAADLSRRLGWLDQHEMNRIVSLFRRAGLPVVPPPLPTERYLDCMALDKKNTEEQIRFILLERIGRARLPSAVGMDLLRATLDEFGRTPAL